MYTKHARVRILNKGIFYNETGTIVNRPTEDLATVKLDHRLNTLMTYQITDLKLINGQYFVIAGRPDGTLYIDELRRVPKQSGFFTDRNEAEAALKASLQLADYMHQTSVQPLHTVELVKAQLFTKGEMIQERYLKVSRDSLKQALNTRPDQRPVFHIPNGPVPYGGWSVVSWHARSDTYILELTTTVFTATVDEGQE